MSKEFPEDVNEALREGWTLSEHSVIDKDGYVDLIDGRLNRTHLPAPDWLRRCLNYHLRIGQERAQRKMKEALGLVPLSER